MQSDSQARRPVLLNEWLKVSSYDGGSLQGRAQYDVKNALTPVTDPFHCSSGGARCTLVLECSQDFTLTHVYVSGPAGPRCTEPVRSGLVWTCDRAPKVASAQQFDSLSAEELRGITSGKALALGLETGLADMETSDAGDAEEALGAPCAYFTTDGTSREAEVELCKWKEGRCLVVRLLDTHGEQERVEVGILAFVGYLGRHAHKQPLEIPLGPWMRRQVRQIWVHPSPLKSMFSSGGWVCDGRDFTGGCRSGQTDFRQTTVYTLTFRCQASGFDLCEKCAHDPQLGRVTVASRKADLDALRDPAMCKLACSRLRNLLKRDWLTSLPCYFQQGLLDTLCDALTCYAGRGSSASSRRPKTAANNSQAIQDEDLTNRMDHDDGGEKWYQAPPEHGRSREDSAKNQAVPEQRAALRSALLQLVSDMAQKLFGTGDLAVGDHVWALRPDSEDHWEETRLVELPDVDSRGLVSDVPMCLIASRDGRPLGRVRARNVWKVTSGRNVMAATASLFSEVSKGIGADIAKISKFLQKGADPAALNAEGSTSLLEAVNSGTSPAILHALLERGACPDVPGKDGMTPLRKATLLLASLPPADQGDAVVRRRHQLQEAVAMLRLRGATVPEDLQPVDQLHELRQAFGRRMLQALLVLQPPTQLPPECLEAVRLLLKHMPTPLLQETLCPEALRALSGLLQQLTGNAETLSTAISCCRIFRALLFHRDPKLQYFVRSHGAWRWAHRIAAMKSVAQPGPQPLGLLAIPGGRGVVAGPAAPGLPAWCPVTPVPLHGGELSRLQGFSLGSMILAGGPPRPVHHDPPGPEELSREVRMLIAELRSESASPSLGGNASLEDVEEPNGFIANKRLLEIVNDLFSATDGALIVGKLEYGKKALIALSDLLQASEVGGCEDLCTAYELERSDLPGCLLAFLQGGLKGMEHERWDCFSASFGTRNKQTRQSLFRLVRALHAVIKTGESFPVHHHKKARGLRTLTDPIALKLRHVDSAQNGQPPPFLPPPLQAQFSLSVEPLVSVGDVCKHLVRVTPIVDEQYLAFCHEVVGATLVDRSSGDAFVVQSFEVLQSDIPLPIHTVQWTSSSITQRILLALKEYTISKPADGRPSQLLEFRIALCQLQAVGGPAAYSSLLETLGSVLTCGMQAELPVGNNEVLQEVMEKAIRVASGCVEEAKAEIVAEQTRLQRIRSSAGTEREIGGAGAEAAVHPSMRVHTVSIAASDEIPFDLFWPMVREDILGAVCDICPRGARQSEEQVQTGMAQNNMGPIAAKLTLEEAEMLAARVGHIVQTAVTVDMAAVKEVASERAKKSQDAAVPLASRVHFLPRAGSEQWVPGVVVACGNLGSGKSADSRSIIDDQGVLWERLQRNRIRAPAVKREPPSGISAVFAGRPPSEPGPPPTGASRRDSLFSELLRIREHLRRRQEEDEPHEESPAFDASDGSETHSEGTQQPPVVMTGAPGSAPSLPQPALAWSGGSAPSCESDAATESATAAGGGAAGDGPPVEEELRVLERLRTLEQILPEDFLSGPMANLRIRRHGSGASPAEEGRSETFQFRSIINSTARKRAENKGEDVLRGMLPAFARASDMSSPTLSLDHPVVERLGADDLVGEDGSRASSVDASADGCTPPPMLRVRFCIWPPPKTSNDAAAPPVGDAGDIQAAHARGPLESLPASWNFLRGMQHLMNLDATRQAQGTLCTGQKVPLDNWSLGYKIVVDDVIKSETPMLDGDLCVSMDATDFATAPSSKADMEVDSTSAASLKDDAIVQAFVPTDPPSPMLGPSPGPGLPAKKRRRVLAGAEAREVAREMYARLSDETQLSVGTMTTQEVASRSRVARCGSNACVAAALELLTQLQARYADCDEMEEEAKMWISTKLDTKLIDQLDDPLSVVSGTLPGWATTLPRLCPFLFSAEARRKLLRYTAFGPAFAVHWTQETKVGPFLHRRATVQTELNAQTNPRKVQELSQELSNIEEHVVKSSFWLGTLQSTLLRVQKGEKLLKQSEVAMELVASSGQMVEVQFDGETGFGSAVTQSFYVEVSLALQERERNRQTPLWVEDDNESGSQYLICRKGLLIRPLPEGPQRDAATRRFRFLGRLMGQALREGFIVPIPLAEEFFAVILGSELGPHSFPQLGGGMAGELCSIFANFAKSLLLEERQQAPGSDLVAWRREQAERSDFSERFLTQERTDVAHPQTMSFNEYTSAVGACFLETGVSGAPITPGGESTPVTIDNVCEFVEQASRFWFCWGVRAQVEAFQAGLNEVFPFESLLAFSPAELRNMFCGEDRIDWDEALLNSHLHPVGGLNEKSPVYKWLVAVLLEMEQGARSRFLDFVSSCPRLPPGGITNFHLDVFPDPSSKQGFPRSRACANQLYLPQYASKEELSEKLHEAVHSSSGHHEQRMRDA